MTEISLQVKGLDKLVKKLGLITARDTLHAPLVQGGMVLAAWIKKNRLTGPKPRYLGVQTGRLRSSISSADHSQGNKFSIKIGTNVIYARIHELGGVIVPVRKQFLRWKGKDGNYVFSKRVVMPARPFLRPAIEDKDNQKLIIDLVTRSINEALQ